MDAPLGEDQIGDRHLVMGVDISCEGGEGAVGHPHRQHGGVLERIGHRQEQNAHDDCRVWNVGSRSIIGRDRPNVDNCFSSLAAGSRRAVRRGALEDQSAFHDEDNAAKGGDVVERISLDRDQVGLVASRDGADRGLESQ